MELRGANKDLGRFKQGWGQPCLTNVLNYTKSLMIDESEILAPLQSRTWNVVVNAAEPFLRVTMVYSDPAATPLAAVHRVNNLSLRVTAPLGTVYWGNNSMTLGQLDNVGRSEDTLNTTENVFVQNPAAGTWQVTVIASEINEDGHVETPELDADFAALVVTKDGVAQGRRGLR